MKKEREEEIARFWKKNNIYQKAKKRNGKKFYFLDGPPYATGSIHLGTAWNKILKDVYIRFFRMYGFNVWDQPGYDTHGLPIENKVQEELKIKSKQDIERLGIEKFVSACRNYATRFIDVMNKQFADLGVWMDWANPYLTLTNDYIEGAWHTFKLAYDKGLLFNDNYSVHVCPHCETAVAYNEIEYEKVTDPSIYVKFPVAAGDASLVIWTTTPWTIPSNTGIMARPDADYVKVKTSDGVLIVAKDLMEALMSKFNITNYKVVEDLRGKQLEGLRYTHPLRDIFPFIKDIKNAHRVVLSEQFVSLDEGTGLVHTAPGHGEEDYRVGKQNNLPVVNPLDMTGKFTSGKYAGVRARDANAMIIEDLRSKGALLAEEKITHDYPLCWRCSTHLLQMAVPQWFFRVTALREKLIKENKKVHWQPDWAQKRFENWLLSLGDWPISRQRYWGIPLPIWVCDCGETKVVGSVKELPQKIKDLHRPHIDKIKLKCRCNRNMKRIPDVLDVWFDSGVASWAPLGYPKRRALFRKMWPSDFQTEGPDQIRGWWNSQLITSIITFDRAPFKNILFHGFVLDAHGIKMSKSKGNVVTPEEVAEKYGSDVLRYYLITGVPWNDFYFKLAEVGEISKLFTVIENTFNFVKTYVSKTEKPKKLNIEDEWILSKLHSLIEDCTANFKTYNAHKAALEIHNFLVNDFSRWYIKLVRDRVWPGYDGADKKAAMYTLHEVSRNVLSLFAPICPFFTEYAHIMLRNLGEKEESVHLKKWPEANKKLVNKNLENDMHLCRAIVEAANSLRHENKIKSRWPLARLSIEGRNIEHVIQNLGGIIKYMCNVKSISAGKIKGAEKKTDKFAIYLDTFLTDELKEEALLREVIRKVQDMRKKAGMVVSDRITLSIENCNLEKFSTVLKKEVGADKITFGKANGEKVEFEGKKMGVEIKRI